VTCSDSVAYLAQLVRDGGLDIDFLYLDSHDLDWSNPHPAALPTCRSCAPSCRCWRTARWSWSTTPPGQALVSLKGMGMVVHDFGISGKGVYLAEFFAKIGCTP
jgi:hypothetical protein